MPYKALTYVMVGSDKLAPGMTVTKATLKEAGQTDEQIAQLVKDGVFSEDMDADIDEAHKPLGDVPGSIMASDEGKGEN